MTRAEAIKILQADVSIWEELFDANDNRLEDALNMAIEALEQAQTDIELSKHEYRPVTLDIKEVERHKPNVDIETDMETCEDCISRQAAIDAIPNPWLTSDGNIYNTINIVHKIMDLPTVQPKHGEWIPTSERLPEEDGDYLVTYEEGYAKDYNLEPIGIAEYEADCESFGFWYENFDRATLGSLGSEWEEIKVIAWQPLPQPYKQI